jgi:2-polyprenyl-3-methyl-5-hydroxy-6-metoxy-1,4-benzoquinol methylase
MTVRDARRRARGAVRDVGTRVGVLPYRGLRWSPAQWEDSFRTHRTDSFGGLDETARYGVLASYLTWLDDGDGLSVLDVGCGSGVLRRHLPSDRIARYVGVDPVPAAVAQASALADERTEFLLADPMTADLGRFDVAICNEVLYFAADPFALVDRTESALRSGGHLLVSMWRHPGDTVLWRHLDRRFELRDRVQVRNPANRFAPRGWLIACLRRR